MDTSKIREKFKSLYGTEATLYASPGRVNLIGEHTDYNGGYVFPCALSFATFLAIGKNDKQEINFRSMEQGYAITVPISCLSKLCYDLQDLRDRNKEKWFLPKGTWANYPLGVFAQFVKEGVKFNEGYDILISGNVPLGAGLSSSAALEVVTAFALNDQLGTNYDRTKLAKIGQKAEHEFAGVMCGIMDQFASANGKKDHAIFLNCDTLQFDLVPVVLDGAKIVITNTHSPHKLETGTYNQRVKECGIALEQLQSARPGLKNLAELSQEEFDKIKSAIKDPIALKRARHVVGEVQRTVDAVKALKAGDIVKFGELMNASHVSLRDDYEVTGLELDTLAEEAWKVDGVSGSRMTGGGFGGCTVSIVKDNAIDAFKEKVGKAYKAKINLTAEFYIAEIGDGAIKLN